MNHSNRYSLLKRFLRISYIYHNISHYITRLSGLLVSFTGYALYTAFGQPSQQLTDPFEEHGD